MGEVEIEKDRYAVVNQGARRLGAERDVEKKEGEKRRRRRRRKGTAVVEAEGRRNKKKKTGCTNSGSRNSV